MLDIRQCHRQIRFRGAVDVAPLADQQKGPTCGFEAVENIIQLFHPTGNDLVETDLLRRAQYYGMAKNYILNIRVYRQLLFDYHIPASWFPFDFAQVIVPALWNNRGVLVVGDAHYLNPQVYPPDSCHAFVLTNYYVDETEFFILGFAGLDSNFAGQECIWSLASIGQSLSWAVHHVTPTPVLVTSMPINWPHRARYYRQMRTGQYIPVY